MQVFGLPGHLIRSARAASRLLAAKTPNIEAERRRDAVARWLAARAGGLSSEAAAAAVGVPLSTLKRRRDDPQSKSRRPLRTRRPTHPPGLAAGLERLRLDHPMWGKAKLTPILRNQGFEVSEARVGRILSELMARGVVPRVPDLIREIAARKARRKRPHAVPAPAGVTFQAPGDVVQIDTMSVAIAPGVGLKHFDAYHPGAKWIVAKPYRQATATPPTSSIKCWPKCPSPSKPSRSTAARSSWPSSNKPAPKRTCRSTSCRRDRPNSMAASNAATAHGDTNSMPASNRPCGSTKSPLSSTPSNTSTTPTDPTAPLPDLPQPST
jgi:hypothetical protein